MCFLLVTDSASPTDRSEGRFRALLTEAAVYTGWSVPMVITASAWCSLAARMQPSISKVLTGSWSPAYRAPLGDLV